ncbi:hypothetical protein [Bosea sp. TAB14]|jgi:hypothetical protein|uniref:hypothetical protein n=1 Tax=Bosea sp. TAB14 TaxID=3237481 RepID=UPI003F8F413F
MRDGHGLVFRSFRPAIRVPIFLFRQRGRPTGELVEAFSAASSPRRPFAARRLRSGCPSIFLMRIGIDPLRPKMLARSSG